VCICECVCVYMYVCICVGAVFMVILPATPMEQMNLSEPLRSGIECVCARDSVHLCMCMCVNE